MRLLHTTKLVVEEFLGNLPPHKYAILSHTWAEEEVNFQDMQGSLPVNKKGFSKLQMSCRLAKHQGYEYIWIDTCCIDKTSSAELSEAINSMYRWYSEADICYAYLADVPSYSGADSKSKRESKMRQSRWFARGWTLQELIAPKQVDFYSVLWEFIGERGQFHKLLFEVTGIDREGLRLRYGHKSISAAKKMSWASKRVTTRLEDRAYSLLGIFDVNMPLLYGEGEKAFIRLQEEILKQTGDESLFAHQSPPSLGRGSGSLLAASPDWFSESADISLHRPENRFQDPQYVPGTIPMLITNKGIQVDLLVVNCTCNYRDLAIGQDFHVRIRHGLLAVLDCCVGGNVFERPAIFLESLNATGHRLVDIDSDRFARYDSSVLLKVGGSDGNEKIEHWNHGAGGSASLRDAERVTVIPEWGDTDRRVLFIGTQDLKVRGINRPLIWVRRPDDENTLIIDGWPFWTPSNSTLTGLDDDHMQGAVTFRNSPRGQLFAVVISLEIAVGSEFGRMDLENKWAYFAQCTIIEIPLGVPPSLEDVVASMKFQQGSLNVSSSAVLALPDGILVHAELGLEEFLFRQQFTLTVRVEIGEENSWRQKSENKQAISIYSDINSANKPTFVGYVTKASKKDQPGEGNSGVSS